MPSKDRDIVAEVCECGSRWLKLLVLVLWPSYVFTAIRAGTSTSRDIFFVCSGSRSKKQAYGRVPYDM